MNNTIKIRIVRTDLADKQFGINEGDEYHAKMDSDGYWIITTEEVLNYYLCANQAIPLY